MLTLEQAQSDFAGLCGRELSLSMERGRPPTANLENIHPLLTKIGGDDVVTDSGIDIRNYGGDFRGIPEARELFATQLRVTPDEIIVSNNSSLSLMARMLSLALLRGPLHSAGPWYRENPDERPIILVTVPGFDRHFSMLEMLGYDMLPVRYLEDGLDVDEVEALASGNPRVKGLLLVPTYANPSGQTLSPDQAGKLLSLPALAPDFTVFADDAYGIHHLHSSVAEPLNLMRLAEDAGQPDRVILYGSTSKITFAAGGVSFTGMSRANVDYWVGLLANMSVGPNKIEQWRHVRFLSAYPGGMPGLMADHARTLKPKFDLVRRKLSEHPEAASLSSWSEPDGGYFITLRTTHPVAARTIELAMQAGVELTAAGATWPGRIDPDDSIVRLAPTYPPLDQLDIAMDVVIAALVLASKEFLGGKST